MLMWKKLRLKEEKDPKPGQQSSEKRGQSASVLHHESLYQWDFSGLRATQCQVDNSKLFSSQQ